MKALLLIPSVLKDPKLGRGSNMHPYMDYYALADEISSEEGNSADIIDYTMVDREHGMTGYIRTRFGRDAALAYMAYQRRNEYDVIYSNGENVGIPLAFLFRFGGRKRPGHVMIGHRLSADKKRRFFTMLHVHNNIDTIFVYATTQFGYARSVLKIPADKLSLIHFHADEKFFAPISTYDDPHLVASAGLEWRDYPTLVKAIEKISRIKVKLAAASPWSKHTNETNQLKLPSNVEVHPYPYHDLRRLYSQAGIIVVPLYENDFQAGITTILEAMAMGKALIVTKTTGQRDVIQDGVTGLMVPPGDVDAMRDALMRLINDPFLRKQLGTQARQWFLKNATLTRWVHQVAAAIKSCTGDDVKLASRASAGDDVKLVPRASAGDLVPTSQESSSQVTETAAKCASKGAESPTSAKLGVR